MNAKLICPALPWSSRFIQQECSAFSRARHSTRFRGNKDKEATIPLTGTDKDTDAQVNYHQQGYKTRGGVEFLSTLVKVLRTLSGTG